MRVQKRCCSSFEFRRQAGNGKTLPLWWSRDSIGTKLISRKAEAYLLIEPTTHSTMHATENVKREKQCGNCRMWAMLQQDQDHAPNSCSVTQKTEGSRSMGNGIGTCKYTNITLKLYIEQVQVTVLLCSEFHMSFETSLL
jgi:hypothetical protein